MRIGVISDTHGLLRPEVAPALSGVDRILHLGDVGKISILKELEKIFQVGDKGKAIPPLVITGDFNCNPSSGMYQLYAMYVILLCFALFCFALLCFILFYFFKIYSKH